MSENENLNVDDFFNALGITDEQVKESDNRQKSRGRTDKRLCMCGHGVSKHRWDKDTGLWNCRPNAASCPCKSPTAVIEVTNTKSFLRKTTGGGLSHALMAGLQGMRELDTEKKESFKKLVAWACTFCGTEDNTVQPHPLTKEGYRIKDGLSLGYDRFVCEACRIKL